MIIDNSNKVFETNMSPDKSMAFGISDVSLVMEVLSTLYKHSVRTLVQEYICNGRDAMREAGTWGKTPMKISVPNSFEPTFKVRDYGVGISPDRMANIFVNYGSSTKRATNTQTGGFGIGAKSAFSYTDSFTVVSYYNGIKYTYLCYMTKEKGGCDLLSQEPTKEKNGVEISVPIKRESIKEFKDAVQRCVAFWQEDIIFEGVTQGEIVQYKPVATLGSNMTLFKTSEGSNTIYLIDGIQYELLYDNNSYNKYDPATRDHKLTINVPNGFFKLSPSRENIQDTLDNKALQQKLIDEAKKAIDQKVNEINSISNLKDKLELRNKFSGISKISRMEVKLSNDLTLQGDVLKSTKMFNTRFARRKRRSSEYVVETGTAYGVDIDKTVLVKPNNNDTALARRLNHYVLSNPTKAILITNDVIPFEDQLFSEIIQSDSLSLPAIKRGAVAKKATSDSIAYQRDRYGSRMQVHMRNVNADPRNNCVAYEDGMSPNLCDFFTVYEIPKCNKDALTKKLLTVQEAHAILVARKSEALGVNKLYTRIKKLSHLSTKTSDSLRDYLLHNEPSFKNEVEAIKNLIKDLITKCPLLSVLPSVHYAEGQDILINEINKQLGE